MVSSTSWENDMTVSYVLTEACLQFVVWLSLNSLFGKWVFNRIKNEPWFKKIESMPGGSEEWLNYVRCGPQHCVASALLTYGHFTNESIYFIHALLAEFGYEFSDIIRIWYLYLFVDGSFEGSDGKRTIMSLTFHHLPGSLIIVPLCLVCDFSNEYFRAIPMVLLVATPLQLYFYLVLKTYDIKKLGERTRFGIVYMVSTSSWIYLRLWLFNKYCVQFLYHESHQWTWLNWSLYTFFFIFMTCFNCLLAWMNVERLYMYMYADDRQSTKITAKLQRHLTIAGSADLFGTWSKVDTSHVKRMPFRRMMTTPYLARSPKGDTPRKKGGKRGKKKGTAFKFDKIGLKNDHDEDDDPMDTDSDF